MGIVTAVEFMKSEKQSLKDQTRKTKRKKLIQGRTCP